MFKKPSIGIYSFLTLFFAATGGVFAITLARAIDIPSGLGILISPGYLTTLGTAILLWLIPGTVFMKRINNGLNLVRSGNSDSPDITKAQKSIVLYQKLSIYLAVVVFIVGSILIPRMSQAITRENYFIFFGLNFGMFALLSVLTYILFLQHLEEYTIQIPFSDKHRSMPYILRVLLVFFFTVSGIVLGILASVEVALHKGHNISVLKFDLRFYIVIVLGVFCVIFDNLLLSRGINHRVQAITKFTSRLAKGDLTGSKMPILSRDEFGKLIDLTNTMQDNLKKLVVNLKSVVEETNQCSLAVGNIAKTTAQTLVDIRTGSNEVNGGTQVISGQITESKALLESLTGSIATILPHIEDQAAMSEESTAALTEMTASIKNMGQTTKERLDAAKQLSESSDKGNENLEKTVEAIERIHSEIKTITEITDLILAIASQTNLLAMNAAIEAAHAGDSGKGFAVVADEIRKLAESSSENSQNIVSAVNEIVSTIQMTLELGGETSLIFDGIHNEMKNLVNSLSDISNGVNEVGSGAEQIMSSMVTLREHSGQLKTNADSMDKETEQVRKSVNELMEGFTEVAEQSNLITEKADNASSLETGLVSNTEVLNRVIATLNEKINDFQT